MVGINTKQQKQALTYFRRQAKNWKTKADTQLKNKVNVIRQRNDYVLRVISKRKETKIFLDIGCGTGDLVCEIAKKGINAVGVDFASEMIEIARNNAKKLKCEKAKFENCSIFDFCLKEDKYDTISANGFIEYISYKELNRLLKLIFKSLRKGGSLILSSRNRLFNIFSLNKFTEEEIKNNSIIVLLLEALSIVNSTDINDLIGRKSLAFQEKGKDRVKTGIEVSTRYQFTPTQLINILAKKGFEPVEIFPIHIHGVIPKFKDKYPLVHGRISNLLQNYDKDAICFIPYASSFMLHAIKR